MTAFPPGLLLINKWHFQGHGGQPARSADAAMLPD